MGKKEYGKAALTFSLGIVFYCIFILGPNIRPWEYRVSAEHARSAERFAGRCQQESFGTWSGCLAILADGHSVRVSALETRAGVRVIIHRIEYNAVDGEQEKRTGVPIGKFLREGARFVFDSPRFYTT